MPILRLLLFASIVPALAAFLGAALGTPFGRGAMFVLASITGTFGVLVMVRQAARLRWLDRARERGASIGALVGLGLGASVAAMALDRPLAILVGSLLIGIGTLAGAGPGAALRVAAVVAGCLAWPQAVRAQEPRPRIRDLGVTPGIFSPGERNAITDVAGVRVGQVTVTGGDSINTGVTAILPHGGNPFLDRVPAAVHVGNGFGKFIGTTQVAELGELETPILLTCTLCVWRAADAMVAWLLRQPGMEQVRSINAVVGETNDGGLNDIRLRPIGSGDVERALTEASGGEVAEGSVGAGRGTVAFGWKGGIGTSSRRLPASLGGWTVGVLVQTNYGGVLQVDGLPVGETLGRHSYRSQVNPERGDGSVIIVIATDAPLTERQLARLAARGIVGLGRTGADASNGSGDYAIAFSTAESVRRPRGERLRADSVLADDAISPVFLAAIEATEEAIYNSLTRATAVTYRNRTVAPLPIDRLRELVARRAAGAP